MVPIRKRSDEEIELEYIKHSLYYLAGSINYNSPLFHAFVDNSGSLPQLLISKK